MSPARTPPLSYRQTIVNGKHNAFFGVYPPVGACGCTRIEMDVSYIYARALITRTLFTRVRALVYIRTLYGSVVASKARGILGYP